MAIPSIDDLSRIDPPTWPLVGTWEVSIAHLVKRRYEVPSVAAACLGQLDRFGALRLTPTALGFDRDDVEWRKVTGVTTQPLRAVLTDAALQREVERWRTTLPPIPGRTWALEKCAAVIGDLAGAALQRAGSEALDRPVVSEVRYQGALGRSRTLSGGMVVVALLGVVPSASQIILDMAEQHGNLAR